MNALVSALRRDGFDRDMALRLLGGKEFSVESWRYDADRVWYRKGDYIICLWCVLGVDDVYLVATGELVPF